MVENKVHLKVPGDTVYLTLVRKVIVDLATQMEFPEDDVAKIEIAVDQACTNVIKHSYVEEKDIELHGRYHSRREEDIERPIDLIMHIDGDKILVTIIDQGKGFDLGSAEIPSLDEYLASMKMGGLGVYVIKTFMDEVSYSRKPEAGNILKMVKYLPRNKEESEVKENG